MMINSFNVVKGAAVRAALVYSMEPPAAPNTVDTEAKELLDAWLANLARHAGNDKAAQQMLTDLTRKYGQKLTAVSKPTIAACKAGMEIPELDEMIEAGMASLIEFAGDHLAMNPEAVKVAVQEIHDAQCTKCNSA